MTTTWPNLLAHIARQDGQHNPDSVGPTVGLLSLLALAWEREVYAAYPDAIGAGWSARPPGTPDRPHAAMRGLMERLAA